MFVMVLVKIKNARSKKRLLLRRGQPLLFRPDLIAQPVVKGREQELHRDPQNDPKAQGIDQ
jgi:hypothetical protein